ncbi:MAG: B12-binding domain-containing radical SAM protein [Alphaproteobacteria bacterium]|nr:B12-binding domain-containing radical SAM protein [Alphaproteobacteria bacterium]
MRVLVANTPNRDFATQFPPIGALSVLNYVRKNSDAEVSFYNIDALRPSREEVIAHIKAFRPDVLGISAIVSTAYGYTRQLAGDVRRELPETLIVCGGNLASAANLLLNRAHIDLCVPGEGEMVFHNIVERARTTRRPPDFKDIQGIVLLDADGELFHTGIPEQLDPSLVWDYDWEDLEKTGTIWNYITPIAKDGEIIFPYRKDPRSHEPHRQGKNHAVLNCVKGCVARCTFCHRSQKGIRHIPVDIVMQRLDRMMEKYNVGFVYMGAEAFGADKRWLDEFLDQIALRDVLWGAGGVRANALTPEWIQRMKAAGCVNLSYGNESGSARMLQIIEKKVSIEQNYAAMKAAIEAGFPTGMQFVVGMPGENEETIRETIDYIKYGTTLTPNLNPDSFAIGYAQALPGTPLYEYARRNGYLGDGMDGEEKYLLSIANKDACDPEAAINYTDTPRLRWLAWRPLMSIEVNYHYYKTFGKEHYFKAMGRDIKMLGGIHSGVGSIAEDVIGPYIPLLIQGKPLPFRLIVPILRSRKPGLAHTFYPALFYRLRHFVTLMEFARTIKNEGMGKALTLGWDYVAHRTRSALGLRKFRHGYVSLRKIVEEMGPSPDDPEAMRPLRSGR